MAGTPRQQGLESRTVERFREHGRHPDRVGCSGVACVQQLTQLTSAGSSGVLGLAQYLELDPKMVPTSALLVCLFVCFFFHFSKSRFSDTDMDVLVERCCCKQKRSYTRAYLLGIIERYETSCES